MRVLYINNESKTTYKTKKKLKIVSYIENYNHCKKTKYLQLT